MTNPAGTTGQPDVSPPTAAGPPGDTPAERRIRDHSPWLWLLLLPIVLPLVTPLFNHTNPAIGGMPLYYWLQLAFVVLSAVCCWIAYWATSRRKG